MALNKKYVVQKSFRIDSNLERDLEQLSNYLNRPQNELVNFALENLMKDNKIWFARNYLVEYFVGFFEGGNQINHYNDEKLEVDIIINEDCTTTYSFHVKDNNYTGEKDYSGIYEDSDEGLELIKDSLRRLSSDLIFTSEEDIEKYCSVRLDYR